MRPDGERMRRLLRAEESETIALMEKGLASLERRMTGLQEQAAGARAGLADLDQSDYQRLGDEMARITALEDEATGLEERWLELSALLE